MTLLRVSGLRSGYGNVAVLHEVSLEVAPGEVVAVVGSNGAGKSTLLRTILGINKPMAGTIELEGRPIGGRSPAAVTAAGVALVPENRRVFAKHTVEENLRLGAWAVRRKVDLRAGVAEQFERFPILAERRTQLAGTLSGGQQQMLAIGMALMARPRLLMLDEPSLGLAPIVVSQVFDEIRRLGAGGTTILLVEQLANLAVEVADRVLGLQLGRIVLEADRGSLAPDALRAVYLGG